MQATTSYLPGPSTTRNEAHPTREVRPALVFLGGELMAVPIPLERPEVVVGRAAEADVRVNDISASRRHAVIRTETDPQTGLPRYRLTDLYSLNGTLLNGQPVKEAYLQEGDKIGIGDQIIRFALLDEYDREYQLQIHRLLVRDDLTGLLSSRSFFFELRREANRAAAEGKPFSVIMLDLDHFKCVNDTYGHLAGNRTLEDLGEIIAGALRVGDIAARFGGEEFAVFLPDTDTPQAFLVAERLRLVVAGHLFYAHGHHLPEAVAREFHVTASFGIASFPQDAHEPIELVEMADSALYLAKRTGRNRVCTFSSEIRQGRDATAPALRP